MVPAARDEEIKTLVVQQSESDTVSTQGNSRKYASAITLLALVAVAGISMHRHFVQSNGTDAEIGDIIEACADYTVQASCSAASCLWNSASVQCEEAAQRAIDNRPYVVAAEREAGTPTNAGEITLVDPATIPAGVTTTVHLQGANTLASAQYIWLSSGVCGSGTTGLSPISTKGPSTALPVTLAVGNYKLCFQDGNGNDPNFQTTALLKVEATCASLANDATLAASVCGTGFIYDPATALTVCSASLTKCTNVADQTKCCKAAAKCGDLASDAMLEKTVCAGGASIYNPASSATFCGAATGCVATDQTTCCKAATVTVTTTIAATPAPSNTPKPDGTIAMALCAAITSSPTTQITLCDKTGVVVGMTLYIGANSVKITEIVGRRLSGEGRQLSLVPVVVSVAPPVIGIFDTSTGIVAKLPVIATPAPAVAAPAPRVTPCTGSATPACNNRTDATGTPDLGEQFSCATQGKPETQMMSICEIFQAHCLQPFDAAWLTNRPRCKGMIPRHDGSLDHVVTGAKVGRWN